MEEERRRRAVPLLYKLILWINYFALAYTVAIFAMYAVQLLGATVSLGKYVRSLRYTDYRRYVRSENMIPVSLLVPAYNEAATIVENVRNLLSLDFPEYEVVVVNDGSSDETMELLRRHFRLVRVDQPYKRSLDTQPIHGIYRSPLYPNLVVADKANGGKADALNAGINLSQYPVFVSMDADSILEKDALIRIIMPFLRDHSVAAVGGIVRIASGCKVENGAITEVDLPRTFLGKLQTVEYLRAFFTGRIGSDALGTLLIISGAFGAFRKQPVIQAGGYTVGSIGEDMDLVVKLHRSLRQSKTPYRMKFLADPICWTQPPERLRDLYKQRKRWQVGLISTLMAYRDMLLRPRYGRIGMFTLPYYWLFELLGPVFEATGLLLIPLSWALGIVNTQFMLLYFLLIVLVGIILSVGALLLETYTVKKFPKASQLLQLLLFCFLDNFGYRQFNTLVRVAATFSFRKSRGTWGSMERKQFSS